MFWIWANLLVSASVSEAVPYGCRTYGWHPATAKMAIAATLEVVFVLGLEKFLTFRIARIDNLLDPSVL